MRTHTNRVSCASHGESMPTYVCSHLLKNPKQHWHCDYPTKNNPWPDAWCDKCNRHYTKEGKWNKNNAGVAQVKVLCAQCYESSKAKSIKSMAASRSKRWESFVSKCCQLLAKKQNALTEKYRLNDYKRWDWDQKTGELIFSNAGIPGVIAKVAFVGSVSTKSNTWLWAWANFHLLRKVWSAVEAVRDYGEARGYTHLTIPKWPAKEYEGWHMTAVAAHLLNAGGAYRTPGESGYTFMVLRDVRFAKKPSASVARKKRRVLRG